MSFPQKREANVVVPCHSRKSGKPVSWSRVIPAKAGSQCRGPVSCPRKREASADTDYCIAHHIIAIPCHSRESGKPIARSHVLPASAGNHYRGSMSFPRTRESSADAGTDAISVQSSKEVLIQVVPMRIRLFNQLDLPLSAPFLHLLLALYGAFYIKRWLRTRLSDEHHTFG
jgi:hypothetical protein